jgi:hypothetical protein
MTTGPCTRTAKRMTPAPVAVGISAVTRSGARRGSVTAGVPKGLAENEKPLIYLVGVAGFEPATPASRTHQPAPYPSQYQRLNPTHSDYTNSENGHFRGPACRLRAKNLVARFAALAAESACASRVAVGQSGVYRLPVTRSEPFGNERACIGRRPGR